MIFISFSMVIYVPASVCKLMFYEILPFVLNMAYIPANDLEQSFRSNATVELLAYG